MKIFFYSLVIFFYIQFHSSCLSKNIEDIINNINIPRENTESFIEPSIYDLISWQELIKSIINKEFNKVNKLSNDLNYDFIEIDNFYLLVEKSHNFKGLGSYIFSKKPKLNIIIEIPHPIFDTNTLNQGIEALKYLKPKALFIAGTHRCSNCKTSSYFDGKTLVCNNYCNLSKKSTPFRESDVGHFDKNFFHYAHKTFEELDNTIFFQFHTASNRSLDNSKKNVDIILSYGTKNKVKLDSKISLLKNKLIKNGVKALIYPNDINILGGTTNLQGRYTNNKSLYNCNKKCITSEKFIHLEQRGNIIRNPEKIFEAIKDIFK